MIIGITGMPGSGKSYALVERAYRALKQGRPVFSNFPIKGCYQFTLDDLCNYTFPEGSVIILDEAGRWFNARNWSKLPPEVFDLFTMHRHLQFDLYVGVQAFNRIDSSLREVIELTYVARKHLFWHSYRGFYEVERIGKMKGDEDEKYIIFKRKRYRKMYDTFSMKSAWHGKPPMPEVLFSPPPPLSWKESLVDVVLKIGDAIKKPLKKKELAALHSPDQIEVLKKDFDTLEQYEEYISKQSYLEQLEHKNRRGGPPRA